MKMKQNHAFFAHALTLTAALTAAASAQARTVTSLSDGWTADGAAVAVPHTWNAVDAADGEGRAPDWARVGYSSGATSYVRKAVLYRRCLPDPKLGKRYFLKCAGASVKSVTRVNGREIGRHTGAFTAFCHEATAALKPAGNVLEMTVDNSFDPDVQPIHADFSVFGGLYRVPEWIETGAVAIDPVTDGASGIVLEPDAKTGDVVAHVAVLGGTNEVRRFHFDAPKLWSPETPNLYDLTVRVRQNGNEDAVTVRFGFRTAEFHADGFYLNGVKRNIRGVCRHQDREGRGWGRSREDEADDVRWIKRMGADGVRTSHYPQSPAFYDLCDEQGLLVWTEVPNVNGLTFTEAARENELREAREMVMQHRNHPSIFAWGIYNELYNMKMTEPPEPRMRALKDYVNELDPSRPVTAASHQPRRTELCAIPDVLGFNLYSGWYGGASEDMGKAINAAFAQNPKRKIAAISEYGCSGSTVQHADATFRLPKTETRFHPEEYQARHHWANYRAIAADCRIWGSFLWVMFDAASDAKQEGERTGLNDKGMVSWDRLTAKDAYFFYKANWNPEPLLHLVGWRGTETAEESATVMAFSNVGAVKLYVNGKLFGERMPDEVKTVVWEKVPLASGLNEIEIRAGDFRKVARWTRRPPNFPKVGKARALTYGPKDHLLANYFAINAWSKDFRYVAVLETEVNGRLAAAGERCTLGLVDTQDGNRFIPVTTTACWNFQEATMFHWLPNEPDTFVFNDLRDGKAVAVVMNWKTRAERVIQHPVAAVTCDGRKAISLNYSRLYLTRPDYGYAGDGQDSRARVEWPEDDGLWLVDLVTGEAKLILSVAAGRSLMPPTKRVPEKPGNPLAYYCHVVFNPSGDRVFFLARSVDWFDKVKHKIPGWNTTSFTVKTDGTDLRRCFARDWGGSHFNWLDDRTMVVTVYPKEIGSGAWHVKFTVGEEEKVHRLAPGLLDWDGHCVYSPDGKWMSTEGYFDGTMMRNWVLMRSADEKVMPVGSFYVPEAYRGGHWRCDLHARWRPDGKQLGFNSVHEGSRQVYVMDVEEDK